jgi:inner membrane protein
MLLLQIPLAMISGQIYERDRTRLEAINDITSKWGRQQNIIGPRLVVPYYEIHTWKNKYGAQEKTKKLRYAVFLPDSLDIAAKIQNETRYRGIFEVPVYQSTVNLQGQFNKPDLSSWGIDPKLIEWDQAQLLVGVSDSSAIQKQVVLRWNQDTYYFEPGLGKTNTQDNGFHVPNLSVLKQTTYKFNIAMVLNGSDAFFVTPLGKNSSFKIQSDWPDPSFQGYKLPNTRKIGATGFEASWAVSNISRNYPQQWLDDTFSYAKLNQSLIGVEFVSPVDNYRMTERSIKYAVLFLLLTFVAIWLIEIFYKIRVHLLQYLLLGLGMSLFYLLLLAFSEYISFFWSYLIASSAVVAMTTLYSKAILKSTRRASWIGAGIVVLYIYLFSLLQEQNYSLLFGSIGVFLTLAGVMYITRNIDWYEPGKRNE